MLAFAGFFMLGLVGNNVTLVVAINELKGLDSASADALMSLNSCIWIPSEACVMECGVYAAV